VCCNKPEGGFVLVEWSNPGSLGGRSNEIY
jgi:hypothetical protein